MAYCDNVISKKIERIREHLSKCKIRIHDEEESWEKTGGICREVTLQGPHWGHQLLILNASENNLEPQQREPESLTYDNDEDVGFSGSE